MNAKQHFWNHLRLRTMQKLTPFLFALLLLSACKNAEKGPDISGIKVNMPVERFEEAFFAIDTNQLQQGLSRLNSSYPGFYPVFMKNILGVSGNPEDEATRNTVVMFYRGYHPIRDSLNPLFRDFKKLQNQIEDGFRHLNYYFPNYKPGKLTTYIGPFDAPGVALIEGGLAIGLQQYAGKDFSVYQGLVQQQMFPNYISRRFEPQYIPVSCLNAAIGEIYPDQTRGRPLIEQIVEKGKQWFLLDKFLPETPDSLKTGYTLKQLAWCEENEGNIWSYLRDNEDFNSIDPVVIQTYIGEAPFTQGMPEASPGNIGQWIGWQIVKKYAEEHKTELRDLLKIEPRKILEGSKYKPK